MILCESLDVARNPSFAGCAVWWSTWWRSSQRWGSRDNQSLRVMDSRHGTRSTYRKLVAKVIKKGRRLTDVDDAIAKGGNVNASRERTEGICFWFESSCWFRFFVQPISVLIWWAIARLGPERWRSRVSQCQLHPCEQLSLQRMSSVPPLFESRTPCRFSPKQSRPDRVCMDHYGS